MDAQSQPSLRYQGYRLRDAMTEQPDPEFTRVGPGMPAGEYFRRFWLPVYMSERIGDLPVALRILGEDLVLFRDGRGQVGLVHRHCSHRGASLEFGVVSPRGIRCCYHGWLFDVDGTIVETPGEPPDSPIRHRTRHGAYPAREYKGLVFAYLGPAEEQPEFPIFDSFVNAGDELLPYAIHSPCNWLQVTENAMDPFHSVFLHARIAGAQFPGLDNFDTLPVVEWHERPYGWFYTNARRVGDNVWIRMHDYFLPSFAQNGSHFESAQVPKYFGRSGLTKWVVPVDDANSMMIAWRHFNDRDDPRIEEMRDQIGWEKVDFYGQSAHRPYEERQRNPGDWEAWTSQGPVNVHKRENLATTDRGVALLRRRLKGEIERVANGERPAQPRCEAGGPIPTQGGDTVLHAPAGSGDDRELILRLSREVARVYVESERYDVDERRKYLERTLSTLSG